MLRVKSDQEGLWVYITERKALHTKNRKYGTYCQKKLKNIENLEQSKKEIKA